MKEKFSKLDFIKMKLFVLQKTLLRKMEETIHRWEKIFTSPITDKGLVSRIYKEPLQFKKKKANNPSRVSSHFTKENVYTANMKMKRCSTYLVMKVETTMKYNYTPVKIDFLKIPDKDAKQLELFLHFWYS